MLGYTFKRFTLMVITIWIITTITFFLMHAIPGTPFRNAEKLTPELEQQLKEAYGLDKPLYEQYFVFLGKISKGDLGQSMNQEGRDVTELLMEGFPPSLHIGLQALLFGTFVGVLLGVVAALNRGKIIDNLVTITSLMGIAVPSFVIGTLLSLFFGVYLEILPVAQYESFEHTILPSFALSFPIMAVISRFIRTEMVEVLNQDFMKTAKSKGLRKSTVILRHALRNALIPAVTVLGPLAVGVITGTLVIENIFAIPGMGKFFVESIKQNDYTVILGTTIFYSSLIVLVLFLVDILYGVIDPRIRISGAKE